MEKKEFKEELEKFMVRYYELVGKMNTVQAEMNVFNTEFTNWMKKSLEIDDSKANLHITEMLLKAMSKYQ